MRQFETLNQKAEKFFSLTDHPNIHPKTMQDIKSRLVEMGLRAELAEIDTIPRQKEKKSLTGDFRFPEIKQNHNNGAQLQHNARIEQIKTELYEINENPSVPFYTMGNSQEAIDRSKELERELDDLEQRNIRVDGNTRNDSSTIRDCENNGISDRPQEISEESRQATTENTFLESTIGYEAAFSGIYSMLFNFMTVKTGKDCSLTDAEKSELVGATVPVMQKYVTTDFKYGDEIRLMTTGYGIFHKKLNGEPGLMKDKKEEEKTIDPETLKMGTGIFQNMVAKAKELKPEDIKDITDHEYTEFVDYIHTFNPNAPAPTKEEAARGLTVIDMSGFSLDKIKQAISTFGRGNVQNAYNEMKKL